MTRINVVEFGYQWCILVALLMSTSASSQDFIGYEYGQTLVLQEIQGGSLYVLCGHADPIMFSSKANFSIWEVKSMDLLNEYLDAQREKRSRPEDVDESLSKLKTVTLEQHDFRAALEAFDLQLGWLPGGTHSCQFEWGGDKEVRVGILNPNIRIPRFGRHHMMSVSEFNKKLKEL